MTRNAQPFESHPDDDLFFEAVRYLLAEMEADESERFELQLAEDQYLRELVAKAMLVLQATCEAQPMEVPVAGPTSDARKPFPRMPLGLLMALAASLLLALFAGLAIYLADGSRPVAQTPLAAESEDLQLAAAWAERVESQSNELTEMWDAGLLSAASASDSDDDSLLVASPDEPPAWMIEALSAQQEEDLLRPAM